MTWKNTKFTKLFFWRGGGGQDDILYNTTPQQAACLLILTHTTAAQSHHCPGAWSEESCRPRSPRWPLQPLPDTSLNPILPEIFHNHPIPKKSAKDRPIALMKCFEGWSYTTWRPASPPPSTHISLPTDRLRMQ